MKAQCRQITKNITVHARVTAQDVELGIAPIICNFSPTSKVKCTVNAVNLAGESPLVTAYGYTKATGN